MSTKEQPKQRDQVFTVLYFFHRLNKTELAKISGYHDSTVGRAIKKALELMNTTTCEQEMEFRSYMGLSRQELQELIRKPDPGLWRKLAFMPQKDCASETRDTVV